MNLERAKEVERLGQVLSQVADDLFKVLQRETISMEKLGVSASQEMYQRFRMLDGHLFTLRDMASDFDAVMDRHRPQGALKGRRPRTPWESQPWGRPSLKERQR